MRLAALLFLLTCAVAEAVAQPLIPFISQQSFMPLLKTNAVISLRHLTNSTSTGNVAEYTTPVFTPTAGAFVFAAVVTSDTVAPDAHVLSSLHGTWTQLTEVTYDTIATPLHRFSVWYLRAASATASALTNKFGNGATGGGFAVLELNGANVIELSGVSAIRQSAFSNSDASANPAFNYNSNLHPNGRSAAIAVFANDVNGFTGAEEGGWTELVDIGYNTPSTGLYVMYQLLATDSSPSVTSASADWAGIIVEIVPER